MYISTPSDDDPEIAMSPLIDCVFLLLIFFLVTTMFKKFEQQIAITVPDSTGSLAAIAEDDSFVLGLDVAGNAFVGNDRKEDGRIFYTPIEDLSAFLTQLAAQRNLDSPLILAVDRETPMQTVVDAFDRCQLVGFQRTSVQIRDR